MRPSALGFKQVIVSYAMFGFEFECLIGPQKNLPRYVNAQHRRDNVSAEALEGGYGWTFFSKGRPPIVWIPRFPKTPREHGTLAHEVAHAVTNMLGLRDVPIEARCDETFCHALSYGVQTILEAGRGR